MEWLCELRLKTKSHWSELPTLSNVDLAGFVFLRPSLATGHPTPCQRPCPYISISRLKSANEKAESPKLYQGQDTKASSLNKAHIRKFLLGNGLAAKVIIIWSHYSTLGYNPRNNSIEAQTPKSFSSEKRSLGNFSTWAEGKHSHRDHCQLLWQHWNTQEDWPLLVFAFAVLRYFLFVFVCLFVS